MSETDFERRAEARRRTLLTGRIEFLNRCTLDCLIRNISDEGAQIALEKEVVTPDVFDLVFVKHQKRRRVLAVWRDQGALGVLFLSEERYRSALPARGANA